MTGIPGDLLKVKKDSSFTPYNHNECFATAEDGRKIEITCSDQELIDNFQLLKEKLAQNDNWVLLVNDFGSYPKTTIDKYALVIEALYDRKELLYSRMEQLAKNSEHPKPVDNFFATVNPPSRETKWCTAFSNKPKWIMPLVKESLCDYLPLEESYKIFPQNPFATVNWRENVTCYRSCHFPKSYEGTINLRMPGKKKISETKNVLFIIHGFLHPSKAHNHIWSHIIGGDNTSKRPPGSPEESMEWSESFQGVVLPNADKISQGNCRRYTTRGCSWQQCSQRDFSRTHQLLAQGLTRYYENAVTFFQEAKTKEMYTEMIENKIRYFIIHMYDETCGNPVCPDFKYYKLLALEGFSFDWETDTPQIHLKIKTFFHKRADLYPWPTTQDYNGKAKGTIENVQPCHR